MDTPSNNLNNLANQLLTVAAQGHTKIIVVARAGSLMAVAGVDLKPNERVIASYNSNVVCRGLTGKQWDQLQGTIKAIEEGMIECPIPQKP